jgi:hypothetical protein
MPHHSDKTVSLVVYTFAISSAARLKPIVLVEVDTVDSCSFMVYTWNTIKLGHQLLKFGRPIMLKVAHPNSKSAILGLICLQLSVAPPQ